MKILPTIDYPEDLKRLPRADLDGLCVGWGSAHSIEIDTFQSNHEGALIDRLHEARGVVDGVVINPGALTHYSYALHDAIEAIGLPVVEVHISDTGAREAWRRESVIRPVVIGAVIGKGIEGYREALGTLAEHLSG